MPRLIAWLLALLFGGRADAMLNDWHITTERTQ